MPEMTGAVGVPRLKEYWSRRMSNTPAANAVEWRKDKLMTDGLGVGLEQIARYLAVPRSFDELERWILELNGGKLRRIDRLNAALSNLPYDSETQRWLKDIDAAAPVLSAHDLQSWDEQGFVVLHDAISAEQCRAAAALVYESVDASPDDPGTWYRRRNTQGIMVQIFQDPRLEPGRTSPRIQKAFAQLWGTADLFPTTDRCGFNPPETTAFRFPGPHLHWDTELTPPVAFGTASILYLTDTEPDQGAFTCVPGFHRRIDRWLRDLPPDGDPMAHIPWQEARPIPGRAGDLVIWHDALPHGSRPNRASRPRIVQYINMYPPPGPWAD